MEQMTDGQFVAIIIRPTMDTYDYHRAIDTLDKSSRLQHPSTIFGFSL